MKNINNIRNIMGNWKSFLSEIENHSGSRDLLNEALKLRDFIDSMSEMWRDDDSLPESIELIRQNQKKLVNYQKVLLQPLVAEDEKFSLIERIATCLLHSQTILNSLKSDPKRRREYDALLRGDYSIIDLDLDIIDAGEKSGVSKASSIFISNNPSTSKIIYKDDYLVAVKPLTKAGSIAWGRGMYDGSREKDAPRGIRGKDVDWCTTVASDQNMFNSYTKEEGINLYYVIKNYKPPQPIFNPSDEYRKICVAFSAQKDIIDIKLDGYATVDAFNVPILDSTVVGNKYSSLLNKIKSDNDPSLSSSYEKAFSAMLKDANSDQKLIDIARNFKWDMDSLEDHVIKIAYASEMAGIDQFDEEYEDLAAYKQSSLRLKTKDVFRDCLPEFEEFIENFEKAGDRNKTIQTLNIILRELNILEVNKDFSIQDEEVSEDIKKLIDESDFKCNMLNELLAKYPFIKSISFFSTVLSDIQEVIIEHAGGDYADEDFDFSQFAKSKKEKSLCLELCKRIKSQIEKIEKVSSQFNRVIRDTQNSMSSSNNLDDINNSFDQEEDHDISYDDYDELIDYGQYDSYDDEFNLYDDDEDDDEF